WGALSWRFTEKTGLSGKDLRDAIVASPGFDVYYCNPFPLNEGLYHNMWTQGEPSHPGFMKLAEEFFDAAGLPQEKLTAIQMSSSFTAANLFVATPAVWEAYINFIRRSLGNAQRKSPRATRERLHSKTADPEGFHFGATYVPFIVERLFVTFLQTDGSAYKGMKIPL